MNMPLLIPGTWQGLAGALVAPFQHASLPHLVLNLVGLAFVLSRLEGLPPARIAGAALFIALVSGLGTWAFGRYGVHLGASGVIVGLFVLGMCRTTHVDSALVAVTVAMAAVLDALTGTVSSWEMHILGATAGALYAADYRFI